MASKFNLSGIGYKKDTLSLGRKMEISTYSDWLGEENPDAIFWEAGTV